MQIQLNGESVHIEQGMSLAQCLEAQEIPLDTVVVERNKAIVPAADFGSTILEADDILEVLHFVGGG